MSRQAASQDSDLHKGSLSTMGIVVTVLAMVTPIGAIVAVVPLAIGYGNGVGVPGAFLVTAAILLCFAAGYAAMSRHITNAGAFYAYIAHGIGRPAGIAAAFVSLISYNCLAIMVAVGFGFFADVTFAAHTPIDLSWPIWTFILLAVVAVLGRRKVELSSLLLGAALLVECLILLALDAKILIDEGFSAFSLDSFSYHNVAGTGLLGVTLVYAFNVYIGFEATAIFGEEAKNPRRSIPRATYIAVVAVSVFYAITTWSLISGAGGGDKAVKAAAEGPDIFVFALTAQYLGTTAMNVMQWLVVSSLFAAFLAVHTGVSRYFFALGRDRVLPEALARTNPRTGSPYISSALQICIMVVAIAAFAIADAEPFGYIVPIMSGIGTLGIVSLQAATAVAVVVFFRRRNDGPVLTTLVLPTIGALGLLVAGWLIAFNIDRLTNRTDFVNQMPWVLVVAALAGLAFSLWMKNKRPGAYAALTETHESEPDGQPVGV